ncbi:hypothetical protein, partial [Bifidobacterium breve]|uniref:hypothetical protein n=1 Tax=Bifidobacterium breve TaxID=1685 RepID=UPI000AC516EE
EKGGVEARVGAVRRRPFVPVPGVWNLDSFNLRLPGRRLGLGDKCVCSIESGPCERVESLQMSGRF